MFLAVDLVDKSAEPSAVVGADAHASGDTTRLNDNIVEYRQSSCYSPTAEPKLKDTSSSPTNAIQLATDHVSDECVNASVMSTDSSTLLLEKPSKQSNGFARMVGGFKTDKQNIKKTKVSSV